MTKTYSKTFVENVRTYARARKISIGDIENQIGISKGYLSRLAKGDVSISLELACQIASLFGVSLAFFLDENLESILEAEKVRAKIKKIEDEIQKREIEIEELNRSIGI